MNIDERLVLSFVAAALAIAVTVFFSGSGSRRAPWLRVTTPFLTLLLLLYYHHYVEDPSRGMAIWILPLATGWLRWRREHTGRPAISDQGFALLQAAYCFLYLLTTYLQTS